MRMRPNLVAGVAAAALALTVGGTALQAEKPSSPATASPCSEVCSGGGYFGTSNTTRPADSLPLNGAAAPAPCSEVCSGGGYFGTSNTTRPADSLPTILNGAAAPAPCSEVCSGGGYGSVSRPSWTPDDSGAALPHDPRPR